MSEKVLSITDKINFCITQKDLIHLGAKYSPCMRKDPNLDAALAEQRAEERTTGCCVRDDGSGCVQTTIHKCSVSPCQYIYKILHNISHFLLKRNIVHVHAI